MQIAIMQKDNLDILHLHNAIVTLNSRVATKILRRFSGGLVKESIIKGRTSLSIYAEGALSGLIEAKCLMYVNASIYGPYRSALVSTGRIFP